MTWWYQWSWMICSGDLSVGALSSSRKVTSLIPSNTCWSLCMEFSMCLWPSDGLSRVWGRPPLMTPGVDSSFTLDPEKDWDVEDGWMNGWMEAWPGPPTHTQQYWRLLCAMQLCMNHETIHTRWLLLSYGPRGALNEVFADARRCPASTPLIPNPSFLTTLGRTELTCVLLNAPGRNFTSVPQCTEYSPTNHWAFSVLYVCILVK